MTTLPPSFNVVYDRVRQSSRHTAAKDYHQLIFTAMSTHCRVHFQAVSPDAAEQFQQDVLHWVSWFEAHYSRFIPDSLIGRINAVAGTHWVDIDPETDTLFNLCQEMVFVTRGVFDPTALPLMKLWNWKATPPAIPTDKAVAEARELVGWRKVQRRKGGIFLSRTGMSLDLGGIGKEYAVDRVLQMALDRGIVNVLVDFGQDVRVHGRPPEGGCWHIGLEDPQHQGKCWTGVAVNNHAVATSGDYVRHYIINGRRYGHIIDPRDGYPVNNGCLSVSVIAPYCTLAGILSTSAFVLGEKEGIDLMSISPGVEAAIVSDNGRVQTRNFNAFSTSK